MVRKLYANFFSIQRAKEADTFAKIKSPGPYPRLFFREKFSDHTSPQSSSTGSPSQGSIMPTSGKFVGMIVHVQFNDLAGVDTDYVFYRINYPWNTVDKFEIGRVHVPGGEIGCFYSDPDTSDGSRSYGQLSALLVEGFISANGSQNAGVKGTTIMIGIDTEDQEIVCPTGFSRVGNECVAD